MIKQCNTVGRELIYGILLIITITLVSYIIPLVIKFTEIEMYVFIVGVMTGRGMILKDGR